MKRVEKFKAKKMAKKEQVGVRTTKKSMAAKTAMLFKDEAFMKIYEDSNVQFYGETAEMNSIHSRAALLGLEKKK